MMSTFEPRLHTHAHGCPLCGQHFPHRDGLLHHLQSCLQARSSREYGLDGSIPSPQLYARGQPPPSTLPSAEHWSMAAESALMRRVDRPHGPSRSASFHHGSRPAMETGSACQAVFDAGSKTSATSDLQLQRKRPRDDAGSCGHCQVHKTNYHGDTGCAQCDSPLTKLRKTANLPSTAADGYPNSMTQVMARLESLEHEFSILKKDVAPCISQNASVQTDSSPNNLARPSDEGFRGASNILNSIQSVGRNVADQAPSQMVSRAQSPVPNASEAIAYQSLPGVGNKTIETLERETRSGDIQSLRGSIDIFFRLLNPHYPSLNENQFRAHFESFFANEVTTPLSEADRHQFLALINLIQAEVKVLSDDWSDSSTAPAWDEFCRAESTLHQMTWLGNGNLLTIQCLLVKARYFFYVENGEGAYDTMGRVVRLCYQLGLHNQPSWSAELSPFDTLMRQRVFWTVFYLERHISLNTGSPYLLDDSNINVDFPKPYDDKLLFPDAPLPEVLANDAIAHSSTAYLSAGVRWGKFSAEVWKSVLAVAVKKPISQEFVASLDARILYAAKTLPAHLKWSNNAEKVGSSTTVPAYVPRQATILHLRACQLRLILRQESIFSMKYDDKTAADCVSIAVSAVDAVHMQYTSGMHPTARFSATLYLTIALLPLVCVVIRSDNLRETRTAAIDGFKKGLSVLDGIAPTFSCARHCLGRISRIIATAKRAIRKFNDPQPAPRETAENDVAAGADPFADLDFSFTDFDPSAYEPPVEPDRDRFNEMLTDVLATPDFAGGRKNGVDSLWMGDLFDNRWSMPR